MYSSSTRTENKLSAGKSLIRITISQRIEDDIRRRIGSAQWLPGQPLPSRRDFAKEYGVGLRTLQKAMAGLLADGTLRADGPKGTFVADGGVAAAGAAERLPESGSVVRESSKELSIGLLWKGRIDVPDNQNRNFWTPIIINVERSLSPREIVTRAIDLSHPSWEHLEAEDAVKFFDEQGVHGIISILDRSPRSMERMIKEAESRGIPIVHAGGTLSRSYRLSVYFSSVEGGFLAASQLFACGCKRILFFSGYQTEWVKQRLQGAREAAAEHELGDDALIVSIGDNELYPILEGPDVGITQERWAYEAASALLSSGLPADGILAVNDQNALGFMKAAKSAGYAAGRDYAIIGFDDFPEAFMNDLTSIRPPLEAVGREAVTMMLREIREPGLAMQVCLPSELAPRASTLAYKRQRDYAAGMAIQPG